MKKPLYFLRNYKFDFLTTLSAIFLYFIAFKYASDQKKLLLFSIAITIILLILIIFLRLKDKDFYFVPLTNRKDKDDWIGSGLFEYTKTHNCFIITNSDPGYIYSKNLTWSDYKLSFEFKIIKKCLGVILRAINLSNYVMLQITLDGIRPHIRINGGWKWWEHEEVKLEFTERLSLDKWYKCLIYCEQKSINIKIFDGANEILNRTWDIPQGSLVFQFKKSEKDSESISIPFPINLEYGSVGFRNYGEEKALIKNILIEKI